MNYAAIKTGDTADGPGVRVSLFVSGCTNHCEGCFQQQTWDFAFGEKYTAETEALILKELDEPYITGLTVLGGEPMELQNQKDVSTLIRKVRERYPDKTIWCYTGFTYEKDLIPGGCRYTEHTDAILDNIDVLVDGRFQIAKRNLKLYYKGSTNQRVIDMKNTRTEKSVVLSKYNCMERK